MNSLVAASLTDSGNALEDGLAWSARVAATRKAVEAGKLDLKVLEFLLQKDPSWVGMPVYAGRDAAGAIVTRPSGTTNELSEISVANTAALPAKLASGLTTKSVKLTPVDYDPFNMTASDSTEAQSSAPAELLVEHIPFVPNEKYAARNWAPERVSRNTLQALASAHKQAVAQDVLSPDLASMLLANTLVEGRPDFGVVSKIDAAKDPHMAEMAKRMGIQSVDAEGKLYAPIPHDPESPNDFAAEHNAKLAAVILAEKAARSKTQAETLRRWSGVGPMARHHARKVANMQRMLNDPSNALVRSIYSQLLGE